MAWRKEPLAVLMPADEVLSVVRLLRQCDLFESIDGGWGLLERQTRSYDDLDLMVDIE